jgi:histone demethylase JARID1
MEREMRGRGQMRTLGLGQVLEEKDRGEDQYSCAVCKTFCYLSQVICQCTKHIVCFEHVTSLCRCPMDQRILRKRFSDETLMETLTHVEKRALAPTTWHNKLAKVLSTSARPQIDDLTALLVEGERIDYPIPQLPILRKCVLRARKWMEAANVFLENRLSSVAPRYRLVHERKISHISALLDEVQDLGFDSPAIDALTKIRGQAERCQERAKELLELVAVGGRDAHLAECEAFLQDSSVLPVYVAEFGEIQKIVGGQQLMQELRDALENPSSLDLAQVQDFIERAEAHNFSDDDERVAILKAREAKGREWVADVNEALSRIKAKRDLDKLIAVDPSETAVDLRLMDRLKAARARASEFDKQAKVWSNEKNRIDRPTLQEVERLIMRSEDEFEPSAAMSNLKQAFGFARDLEVRCDDVLKGNYQQQDSKGVFDVLGTWRDYAHRHLDMFVLPQFEKLDKHCVLHQSWLESLPWYIPENNRADDVDILRDVIEFTRQDDESAPSDPSYSCVCMTPVHAPPPGRISDAVQCDNCSARFHGVCTRGGSCPFCDQKHWDGSRPGRRSWHFAYLQTVLYSAPEMTKHYSREWKNLEVIVRRVNRLMRVIGQFLDFTKVRENQCRDQMYQVRHYLRKLLKLEFVVAPNVDTSFGLELAGLHRLLAHMPEAPPAKTYKKRKRPKFSFGQDVDRDWQDGTRCVCRGRSAHLLNYPKVECEGCARLYHADCVFYPLDPAKAAPPQGHHFICPLCCARKGRGYAHAEVRVKDPSESALSDAFVEANVHPPDMTKLNTFVDTLAMLDTFSKDMIYTELPPPVVKTLFIDLVKFIPGQPDYATSAAPLMSRQSMVPLPSDPYGVRPDMVDLHNSRPPGHYYNRLDAPPVHHWNGAPNGHGRTWDDPAAPRSSGYYGHPTSAPAPPRVTYLPNPGTAPLYTPSSASWVTQEPSVSGSADHRAPLQSRKRKIPDDQALHNGNGLAQASKRVSHTSVPHKSTPLLAHGPSEPMHTVSRPGSRTSSISRPESSLGELHRDAFEPRRIVIHGMESAYVLLLFYIVSGAHRIYADRLRHRDRPEGGL